MSQNTGEGVVQKAALMCEAFSFPGRNLDSQPDSNVYGPEREIVNGYSFGDISSTFIKSPFHGNNDIFMVFSFY